MFMSMSVLDLSLETTPLGVHVYYHHPHSYLTALSQKHG